MNQADVQPVPGGPDERAEAGQQAAEDGAEYRQLVTALQTVKRQRDAAESRIAALEAALERMAAALRAVEWCDRVTIHSFPEGDFPEPACPCCKHAQRFGHYRGCTLATALAGEGE